MASFLREYRIQLLQLTLSKQRQRKIQPKILKKRICDLFRPMKLIRNSEETSSQIVILLRNSRSMIIQFLLTVLTGQTGKRSRDLKEPPLRNGDSATVRGMKRRPITFG